MTYRAVIAFGSNLGDRFAYLQGGVDALLDTPGTSCVAQSAVYETDPVGGPEQPAFLNAVVIVDTPLPPVALLDRAHAIEEAFERARVEHWGPRTLDVDIVAVGDDVVDTGDLTIPHKAAHDRAFVLVPWLDADPDAYLVGHGKVADLVTGVDRSGVRATEDVLREAG
ncbi:MAG: 2-amino-4-hydroxy-6-hydroxymethyldihydropteridine diphosphokinase [Streptosporangiales bacterium]|nr:2-amino-4-hydroxy-6-hydroxymethyldihydropteridine diphosphokinase [Streptosporangiales bacterium]